MRLGESLLADGHINEVQLQAALQAQTKAGGRLGEWLTSLYHFSPRYVFQALAAQQSRLLIDPTDWPAQPALADAQHVQDYLHYRYLPWDIRDDGCIIIASTHPEHAMQCPHLPADYQMALITPRDFHQAIYATFGEVLEQHSREWLAHHLPEASAAKPWQPAQPRIAILCLCALLGIGLFDIEALMIGALLAVNLLYLASIGLKLWLYLTDVSATTIAPALTDEALPLYSVLVPLYREERSIPALLSALRALDYPRAKLDIKLIVEADDNLTLKAIRAARPEACFDIIIVPDHPIKTKPRACAYALQFAKGKFVTIFDAEDQPAPNQLRRAAEMFAILPAEVACLQARLNYYNATENLLTRLFAIEYSVLFDRLLPALAARRLPIPLGGTSNHLRMEALKHVHSWDPYNVTEDADLGLRLARFGYRTAMLDSVTMEEAPLSVLAWAKQRTRWIKGYVQSWAVLMRRPDAYANAVGLRGFWVTQLFVGAPFLVFLLSPLLWMFSALLALYPEWLHLPTGLWPFSLLMFTAGIVIHLLLAIDACRRWQWPAPLSAILAFPFYWWLHSLASFRAGWQLVRRPYFWDKTSHGLTCFTPKSAE